MGVANDVVAVRRRLSRIALDSQKRSPGDPRDDLIRRVLDEETEARRLGQPVLIACALLERAELLLAAARTLEAVPVLERVGPELRGKRQDDLRVRALALLAGAHAREKDWPKVSDLCEEGIALVEKYRFSLSSEYLASAYLQARIPLYAWGARSAWELGRPELMIERAELSKCRSILVGRDAGGGPHGGLEGDRTAELRALSRRIAELPAGEVPEPLLARRRFLWELIALQRQRESPPAFSLSAVQSTLRVDEAILYYYWLDRLTLLIATIDRDGFEAELRELSPVDRASLETYAGRALTSGVPNHSAFEAVRHFGSFLLPAASAVGWPGKRRLLVSPHRVLHSVPFHALRFEERWLIERAAVSYVPNLSSLLFSHRPPRKRRVLIVGVDRFAVPGRALPPLPDAELEAREVQRSYARHQVPTTALLGKEATAAGFHGGSSGRALREYSCLHFATHGENVDSENPMESRFYLQNSLLDGLEIAHLDLEAETVVLSACSSGQRPVKGRGLTELPGDELFGLQAAFFRAGAHRILATLWPVESPAARKIATGFHARMAADRDNDAEGALQGAVCSYLNQAGLQQRKIYFWAPFFLSVIGRAKPGRRTDR